MADEKRPLLSRRPSVRDDRPLHHRRLACVVILLSELLERLAFYATSFNLVLYLNQQPLNWSAIHASNAEFTLSTFAFGFCFFAGYLADAKLGRFRTIVIFYVVLAVGYALMILSEPHRRNIFCYVNTTSIAWSGMTPAEHRLGNWTPFIQPTDVDYTDNPPCKPAMYISLVLIGIGTAAVRTNIAPFGADQVRAEGPESMRMFFNWLYWCVNLGSLIAIMCVTYLEQTVGFFWGFVTTLSAVLLALCIFLTGSGCYVRKPAPGTRPLGKIIPVIRNAIKNRRQKRNQVRTEATQTEPSLYPRLPSCPFYSEQDSPNSLLDHATVRYGGHFQDQVVYDIKFFFKILVIFLSIVPYWTVYFQMNTTYLLQGLHMRVTNNCSSEVPAVDKPHKHFHILPVWLSAFDVVCTIIFIPIVDRLIYRFLDRRGYPLSLRTRIAIGMVFTILSVLGAGLLEHYRLATYWEGDIEHPCIQVIGGTIYYAADISVFMQIPQYALIGISEIFTSIAGMEMAYAAAPKSMQGVTMGLFLLFSGVGALIGVGTMYGFHDVWFYDWDNGNINCRFACPGDESEVCAECRLDYYFYFLAGFQLLGLVMFLVTSRCLGIGYMCPCSENTVRSINRQSGSQGQLRDAVPS